MQILNYGLNKNFFTVYLLANKFFLPTACPFTAMVFPMMNNMTVTLIFKQIYFRYRDEKIIQNLNIFTTFENIQLFDELYFQYKKML